MNQTVIKFDGVYKNYPLYHHLKGGIRNLICHPVEGLNSFHGLKFEALHDISFEVKKGESLGVIGKNGAGKSTLLGLIAGVIKPTHGRVLVESRVFPMLELGAGFHPELTGRENILLKGVLMGCTRKQVRDRLDAIIDFSELNNFVDQPIRTYSSGMLARLGFSVVAHLNPEILLMDEILAVGDKDFQAKCLNKIREFRKEAVTMIFVSHMMADVQMVCDNVIWLENHEINMLGSAEDVISKYS